MDRMRRRAVLFETDTDYLLDQVATSQAQISLLSTRIASEKEGAAVLDSILNQQVESQITVRIQVEELGSSGRILSETVNILVEGVSDLQGDVNENVSQIDQVGGQADAILIRAAALESQLAALEGIAGEPGEELIKFKEVVGWLHLWGLVSSARLRLAENNPGLAAVDIEQAYLIASSLRVEILEEEEEASSGVADRLELALANLPDDPGSAARDLESAWDAIEQILVELLGIGPENIGTDNIGFDKIGPDSTVTIEAGERTSDISKTPESAPTGEE